MTKFKETEIGKIPDDWGVHELKHLLEEKGYIRGPFGSALRRPELKKEGIPVYEQQNAIYDHRVFRFFIDEKKYDELKRFTTRENDLLISCSGTFGKVSIIKKEDPFGIISQALLILRPDVAKVYPNFLKYYFTSSEGYNAIASRSIGSVQINIAKREIIEKIILAVPPLQEQRAIAKILSDLDAKIELNRQMNQTLEQIGEALFKRWFVDFEFPNEEGKPYKSSGGKMVESELGEIPEEWTIKPIDEVADFLNGLALQKFPPKTTKDYLPVIKIRELKQGITESSDKADVNIPSEYIVTDGNVLFSWSGSLEVTIWCGGKGALNQHLFKVTSSAYPKWFYYFWILEYLEEYRRIAEGKATTMGHIQRHHLKSSLVLIPDTKTLSKMDNVLGSMIDKIIKIKIESKNLSQIRDSLLPKLMSGEIRV